MANVLTQPWICTYLVHVAETHGGDLLRVPRFEKNKKVQVIKFLTPHEVGSGNWVWAVVSDKTHHVPARLSREAMEAFESNPQYAGRSLSAYKTAVMTLKSFRPMFCRAPTAEGAMAPSARVVLEVGEFTLLNGFGEEPYGRPRDVAAQEAMREWSAGLEAGGGGGNVLKLRREERMKAAAAAVQDEGSGAPRQRRPLPVLAAAETNVTEGREAAEVSRPRPPQAGPSTSRAPTKQSKERNRKAWARRWAADATVMILSDVLKLENVNPSVPASVAKKSEAGEHGYAAPRESASPRPRPPRKRRNALEMSSPSPSPPSRANLVPRPAAPNQQVERARDAEERQSTPSQWSPSVAGSQRPGQSSPIRAPGHAREKADEEVPDSEDERDVRNSQDRDQPPDNEDEEEQDPRRSRSPQREDSFDIRSSRSRSASRAGERSYHSGMEVEQQDIPMPSSPMGPSQASAAVRPHRPPADIHRALAEEAHDHDAPHYSQSLPPSSLPPPSQTQSPAYRAHSLPALTSSSVPHYMQPSTLPFMLAQAPVVQSSGSRDAEAETSRAREWERERVGKRRYDTLVDTSAGRVLVPDSDPSNSQSQRHTDSQTQGQEQSQMELQTQGQFEQSQLELQTQAPEDSQESVQGRTGPTQSLSYTSASQSQSQPSQNSAKAKADDPAAMERDEVDAGDGDVDMVVDEDEVMLHSQAGAVEMGVSQAEMEVDEEERVGVDDAEPAHVAEEETADVRDEANAEDEDEDPDPDDDAMEKVATTEVQLIVQHSVITVKNGMDLLDCGSDGSSDGSSEAGYGSVPGEDYSNEGDSEDEPEDAEASEEDNQVVQQSNAESQQDELDSDDERIQEKLDTAHDVSQHGIAAATTHASTSRVSSPPSKRTSIAVTESHDEEGRLHSTPHPPSPRRPTKPPPPAPPADDSPRAPKHSPPRPRASEPRDAPPATSAVAAGSHDAAAWSQPSFMRTPAPAPVLVPARDGKGKRRASAASLEREDAEARPRKRPRRDDGAHGGGAALRARESAAREDQEQYQERPTRQRAARTDRESGPSTSKAPPAAVARIRYVDFSRSGSSGSSASARSVERTLRVADAPSKDSSRSSSSARGVKVIDFREVVHAGARPGTPGAAAGKAGPPSNPAGLAERRKALFAKTAMKTPTAPSADAQQPEPPAKKGKLGGYKLDLAMVREPGGPPLVTWSDLTDILLRTGRARYKEEKAKQRQREAQL